MYEFQQQEDAVLLNGGKIMTNSNITGMKRYFLVMMAVLVSVSYVSFAKNDQESEGLKVMSYNIRYGDANDGTNSWSWRYPATAEMIKDQQPDVFGVQEALSYQVLFIKENFRDYDYVGVGRSDGKKDGEYAAVFWNKKRVSMLKWGYFWLSETPDKPSLGWDAVCYRIATWALMKDKKTGRKFYFVNTHLDHVGVEARKNGLQMIADRIGALNKDSYPVVLTGDFNVTPENEALKTLEGKMKSARSVASRTDNKGTFNNWGKDSKEIDYIYFSGFSACPEFETVTKKYAKRSFVSDHFPITARLIF